MKLKFESDLTYQLEAIKSITNIFEGQEIIQTNFTLPQLFGQQQIGITNTDLGIGNKLSLLPEELLENARKIQIKNGLKQSKKLQSMDFSVEMETGTGKTYVYLRSIFELNQKYRFTKFIIVVPSIAIKEGTNKSLEITKEHFKGLYNNTNYDFFTYDSSKLEQVRSFSTSDYIQIMVINIDAFRKSFTDPTKETKANIIHRKNDKLSGYKPIDFISQTNPIVIVDEPQSVDSTTKSKEAMKSLNPLCTLRYSATHKEKYNLMYKLDSIDAYEKKLVKQIEVSSVKVEDEKTNPYIFFKKVNAKKQEAVVEIDRKKGSKVVREDLKIKHGNFLGEKTGLDKYSNYVVNEIYFEEGNEYIDLGDTYIKIGEMIGGVDQDQIKRIQIRRTIEEHLDKELRLNKKDIKVLSLFFIDKVSNYRGYDDEGNQIKGKYAQMFEEEYKKLIVKPKYNKLNQNLVEKEKEAEICHDGYFSIDKKSKTSNKKDKFEYFKDTKGNTNADNDTFNKIMKDKEKLLSFSEPLRFIWSHSALKEGWDNPNVFQICTLNETNSEMKKRQEIGRGLRIAVNQSGERVRGFDVNTLTVMANESYDDFVKGLQTEMEKEENIKFGIVNDHAFANIVIHYNDKEDTYLGQKKSEELWKELIEKDYIDNNGKITDKLKTDLKENKLDLPEEFENLKEKISHKLKRIAGNLNIKNTDDKEKVELNKQIYLGEEFKELWEKIKYKSTYKVDFNSGNLIEKCASEIKNNLYIGKTKAIIEKVKIEQSRGGLEAVDRKEKIDLIDSDGNYKLPDIISYLQNETNLTRKSISEILIKSKKLKTFIDHPQKFIEKVIDIIKTEMRNFIIDGIKYHKIGEKEFYSQELFEDKELFGYINKNMIESSRSPYTYSVYDSNIEKEFVENFESSSNVKVYSKLPSWFKIETPLGNYNPDWAVLIDEVGEEKLYFVVESKGSIKFEDLRPVEQGKIICGKKHFEAINPEVKFETATNFSDLKDKF